MDAKMRRNQREKEPFVSFSEKLVNELEFPKDLMLKAALVTVTGRRELVIANYRGILEYEDSQILIQTKNCRILISGLHLAIDYYTREEMKITGWIDTIAYED
jgi:sporulation protein YqfC